MEGKSIKKWIKKLLLTISLFVVIVVAGYYLFQSRIVQSYVISIITNNIAKNTGVDLSIKRVNIAFFKKVILDDIYISDKQKDTLVFVDQLVANVDSISFKNKRIHFGSITFKHPKINLSKVDSTYNFSFLFSNTTNTSSAEWKSFCPSFSINQGEVSFSDSTMKTSWKEFFHFYDVNLKLDNVQLLGSKEFRCDVKSVQLTSKDGLKLEGFSTQVAYTDSVLTFNGTKGHTTNSKLDATFISLNFKKYLQSKSSSDIAYTLNLDQLDLAFKDISFVLESFKNKDFKAYASGEIKGRINDLRGKNVMLSIGDFTKINCDFYINGLPDWEKTYLFLNLNESYANLNEIRNLDLPNEIMKLYSHLPQFLSNVEQFNYKGNFTGFIDDFVAYGTAYGDQGTISTDLSFKPISKNVVKVDGHISTNSLSVGTIFKNEKLDKLTLTGEIKGEVSSNNKYNLTFKGIVDSIDFNNYKYRNIALNGNIENKKFDGTLAIDDPNLKMNYNGKLDLVPTLPLFEFIADVKHADLKRLHLVDDDISTISVLVDANFEGNNIDNVQGKLVLSNLQYRNANDLLQLSKVILSNTTKGDSSSFFVQSDLIDGELKGKYNFANIGPSLVAFYRRYLPASYFANAISFKDINQFRFNFRVKDLAPLTKVFKPELFVKGGFNIKGFYNTANNSANLETLIPNIKFQSREIENLKIHIDANGEKFVVKAKTDKLKIASNLNVYNLSVDSEGKNDQLALNFLWSNFGEKTYSGNIKTLTSFQKSENNNPHLILKIEPSKVYFADSLWLVDNSEVQIDSTSIKFNKLTVHHNQQNILLDGTISENATDEVNAIIENIDLQVLEPLIGSTSFYGKINGRAKISDFYSKLKLEMNLAVNGFSFDNNGLLGDLTISSKWNNELEKLESEVYLIKDGVSIIEANGFIDPLKGELDLNLEFDNSPLSILQTLLPSTFYNEDGLAKGNVRVYGKLNHFMHDGKIVPIGKASFGVNYLKTIYYTSSPFYFHRDSILFSNLSFSDKFGNQGLLDGSIKHTNFNDMKYNLKVIGTNLQVMNTTIKDNDAFYGNAFVTGSCEIKGEGDNILLSGKLTSSKGTNLFIPFESGESAEQYSFVEFIKSSNLIKEEKDYDVETVGLNIDFDVDVTPEAKIQIIINSKIGDVIKSEGKGNLNVKMDKNYNLSLYGNYVIEKGDYLFTLKNVINKKFSIERGGSLKWNGDPYNAMIDLSAVYRVKTSLYDLFAGSLPDYDLSRRIPVNCIINLSESLLQPKIDFAIELPTAEERIKDEVGQMIVSQEEINRQILSLLIMGRFYTPEFIAGRTTTTTGADLVGNNTLEFVSNQLNNWLSGLSKVVDLGVNYRLGNEFSNKQIELAIGTQILNDRVTIDGNIANNTNQASTKNSSIIGDVDINVKLTDNGKLQFKAYTHSNDNLIYDTAPNTQGIGFTFREEFNSFLELFTRYKEALFANKKVKKKSEKSIEK